MRFFRRPERSRRLLEEERPLQRFFRLLLISLLFCGVIWGFWLNNERMLAKVAPQQERSVHDGTGALKEDELALLEEYARRFRTRYGVELVIRTGDGIFGRSGGFFARQGQAVLIGLDPASRTVIFDVPPLVAPVLGEVPALYLRHVHFLPYFADGSWPRGLAAALNIMTARLDAALLPTRP